MLHGVVIGINKYRDNNIPDLRYARADALAVATLLEERIAPHERSIRLLVDEGATRLGILTAIGEQLPRMQSRDDLVLIYFAGHGSPEQQSPPDRVARYLVPHDAEYGQIFATGIGLEQELVTILQRQGAGRVLIVLDACFSGLAGGRTFLGPSLQRTLSMFRGKALSLRGLDLGYGRAVLAACRDDELAKEEDGHGIFTYHLIQALTAPGEKVISIVELYQQIHTAVLQSTQGLQRPVLKGELAGFGLPRLCPSR